MAWPNKDNGPFDNWLLDLEKILAWYTGVVLQGYTLKTVEGGWLLVVRATDSGKAVVAFAGGRSTEEAVREFARQIKHKDINWRPDKYRLET